MVLRVSRARKPLGSPAQCIECHPLLRSPQKGWSDDVVAPSVPALAADTCLSDSNLPDMLLTYATSVRNTTQPCS